MIAEIQTSGTTSWSKVRPFASSRLTINGVVVIAIPVLFLLAIIGCLKVLLDESQAQLDKEETSKAIIVNSRMLGGAVITAMADQYAIKFDLQKGRDKYIQATQVVDER